ncbi:MAG TPA: response regulator [Firmicutes bacterium]|nr:response regulator [Bacillota bacterium]
MFGLLLVEDEEAIKEKLMNNVAWAEYGFEPVLGASNGLEALALLEKHPVKIMVTDVQMPKMNGIELIKEIKRRGYQMKIIVISGYAEFEYAQESIKLNVSDYLLKPFASKRLLEVVLRFREELEKEEAERSEINDLRDQLRKNKTALVEKLLLDLLNGNVVANIDAQLDFLGISGLNNRAFQVAVIELPENQLSEMNEEEKYLLSLRLYQQVQRLAEANVHRSFVVNHHRNQVVLIFIEPDRNLPLRLEEILSQTHLTLKLSVACGLGRSYWDLADLAVSYREACSALQYRYLYGMNQVFFINDLNPDNQSYHKILNALHRHPIFDNIKIGAASAIDEDLNRIINEIRLAKLNPELAKMVASNLILLTLASLNELGYNAGEIFGANDTTLVDLNQVESLEDLKGLLNSFFNRINNHIRQKRASLNHQLVEEIRRYLDENFAADITLSAMAHHYNISPSYLSLLFTEQTGKNFIDYLTERRIKKAKELLKHTDLKIYEVSNAVGYKDSYYFSNCFKKMSGMSPSEYRENTK